MKIEGKRKNHFFFGFLFGGVSLIHISLSSVDV